MVLCKLCGESLYGNMNYSFLFKSNVKIHDSCSKIIRFQHDEIIIPIDYNYLIYDYVLENHFPLCDLGFMEMKYLGIIIKKHLQESKRSMILYLDEEIECFLLNHNTNLLFLLSKEPIIFISFWDVDINIFEKL